MVNVAISTVTKRNYVLMPIVHYCIIWLNWFSDPRYLPDIWYRRIPNQQHIYENKWTLEVDRAADRVTLLYYVND